jgi:hypothetical protein
LLFLLPLIAVVTIHRSEVEEEQVKSARLCFMRIDGKMSGGTSFFKDQTKQAIPVAVTM